jgi:hypothetical protein
MSPQPTTSSSNVVPLTVREQRANDYIIVNTASTMRVLNVLRHWLTKHPLVSVIFAMNDLKLIFTQHR